MSCPSRVPAHPPSDLGPPYEVRLDDPRLPEVVAAVRARLARIRDGLSDAEFDRLVADVARFHLRWLGTHT